jgi:tripartite-type tricarboxylate transporter receptor subunit TctC
MNVRTVVVALIATIGGMEAAHTQVQAQSQAYPWRPITLIVPYSAGGPTDTLGRIIAEHMRTSLGQSVVIENVTGAGGTIGVGRVARAARADEPGSGRVSGARTIDLPRWLLASLASAAPDGYTLGIGQVSTNGFNGAVYQLPYDIVKDLEPVALLTIAPMWLIGKAALPAGNVKELVAWLKSNPDKASMAAVGWGGASHLCGVYFQSHTGTRFTFVPYRGAAPRI